MLDLEFVRSQFLALHTSWALMDNAGGSAPCRQVIDRIRGHMERLPVQLGASYGLSVEARDAVAAGRRAAATLVGAEPDEIVLGASATVLAQQLATALRAAWEDTLTLHLEDLEPLFSERTRLVAFTHCSNIVGGGVIRVSLVHYNSQREVARLVEALDELL